MEPASVPRFVADVIERRVAIVVVDASPQRNMIAVLRYELGAHVLQEILGIMMHADPGIGFVMLQATSSPAPMTQEPT